MQQSLTFFIAGIMQGSYGEMTLHDQSYRVELTALLQKHFPGCRVYDPFAPLEFDRVRQRKRLRNLSHTQPHVWQRGRRPDCLEKSTLHGV